MTTLCSSGGDFFNQSHNNECVKGKKKNPFSLSFSVNEQVPCFSLCLKRYHKSVLLLYISFIHIYILYLYKINVIVHDLNAVYGGRCLK